MGGEGLVSVGMSLVINTVFDLNESPVFKQVPGGAKSTESSSKSSSMEGRTGRFGEVAERLKAAVC
jgi:hypothetical protein